MSFVSSLVKTQGVNIKPYDLITYYVGQKVYVPIRRWLRSVRRQLISMIYPTLRESKLDKLRSGPRSVKFVISRLIPYRNFNGMDLNRRIGANSFGGSRFGRLRKRRGFSPLNRKLLGLYGRGSDWNCDTTNTAVGSSFGVPMLPEWFWLRSNHSQSSVNDNLSVHNYKRLYRQTLNDKYGVTKKGSIKSRFGYDKHKLYDNLGYRGKYKNFYKYLYDDVKLKNVGSKKHNRSRNINRLFKLKHKGKLRPSIYLRHLIEYYDNRLINDSINQLDEIENKYKYNNPVLFVELLNNMQTKFKKVTDKLVPTSEDDKEDNFTSPHVRATTKSLNDLNIPFMGVEEQIPLHNGSRSRTGHKKRRKSMIEEGRIEKRRKEEGRKEKKRTSKLEEILGNKNTAEKDSSEDDNAFNKSLKRFKFFNLNMNLLRLGLMNSAMLNQVNEFGRTLQGNIESGSLGSRKFGRDHSRMWDGDFDNRTGMKGYFDDVAMSTIRDSRRKLKVNITTDVNRLRNETFVRGDQPMDSRVSERSRKVFGDKAPVSFRKKRVSMTDFKGSGSVKIVKDIRKVPKDMLTLKGGSQKSQLKGRRFLNLNLDRMFRDQFNFGVDSEFYVGKDRLLTRSKRATDIIKSRRNLVKFEHIVYEPKSETKSFFRRTGDGFGDIVDLFAKDDLEFERRVKVAKTAKETLKGEQVLVDAIGDYSLPQAIKLRRGISRQKWKRKIVSDLLKWDGYYKLERRRRGLERKAIFYSQAFEKTQDADKIQVHNKARSFGKGQTYDKPQNTKENEHTKKEKGEKEHVSKEFVSSSVPPKILGVGDSKVKKWIAYDEQRLEDIGETEQSFKTEEAAGLAYRFILPYPLVLKNFLVIY